MVDNINTPLIDGIPEEEDTRDTSTVDTLEEYIRSRRSDTIPVAPANENDIITVTKNRIALASGLGVAAQKITNTLTGFNHRMVTNPIPNNREYGGLVFFTRPDLNLNFDNISQSRIISNMVMQDPTSLDYSILGALDPWFEFGFAPGDRPNFNKPFMPTIPFDNLQAFIPMLSSNLVSLSGGQDNSIDNWLSDEGLMREQWGMVDSTHEVNYGYTVSATFNNPVGDPIMKLVTVWLEYMSKVKMGIMRPRILNSIQRRIDYQSRIYILKYDALGNLLRFNTICVAWPMNNNAGMMANVDNSKPQLNDDLTVTIQFQALGARPFDPLYMETFNETVMLFNHDMIPDINFNDDFVPTGANIMRKLEPNEMHLFNYYGYPRIDSIRRKLTWWVYETDYNYIMGKAGLL